MKVNKVSLVFLLIMVFWSSFSKAQPGYHHQNSSHFSASTGNKITTNETEISAKKCARSSSGKQGRIVHLTVGYKMVNYSGKMRRAIAVNNQIPAPTLHFIEGDQITIQVHNQLDKGTAIHWHGIIVPWQMDGVENVTQKAIPPGGTFSYSFTIRQSGTYWYHAHSEAQEQDGLYGAFLIEPLKKPSWRYTKDYVVVLSDWNDMGGDKTFASLKKEGDYFSPRFPLQPSLARFVQDYRKSSKEERKLLVDDYKMMQQMRMSIYDFSDVAYDAYLLNGQTSKNPWQAKVKKGDVVRLRFIGAGGSTIYRVKINRSRMQMVHVQGNDVEPYTINDFSIAPGETYDVLVHIEKNAPYIIYAQSIDTLGKAFGALVTSPSQSVNYHQVQEFPEPLPVTRLMMENMMMNHGMDNESSKNLQPITGQKNKQAMPDMKHNNSQMQGMDHGSVTMPMDKTNTSTMHSMKENHAHSMKDLSHDRMQGGMDMPTEPSIMGERILPMNERNTVMTMGTRYQNLIAAVKTNDPTKPVDGVINMELFGYMDRFIWMINGLPEYKAKPIIIEPGKRYRIVFTNNSMMRHPMHIHGHWFILRNGHGTYDPLLHTIEVPPGATAVADFDTDASGQWFFHCHHLFHMMAGMSRVFQYQTIIEVAEGAMKPEHEIGSTGYYNRPIVRIDEEIPLDTSLIQHPQGHHAGFYFASFLDIGEDPFHNVQKASFKGLYGGDYNKLELYTEDAEINQGRVEYADMDIFYWRLLSQFWALKGGVNYFYRPGGPYWQPGMGIEGTAPWFIDTNIRVYYFKGSVKLDAELMRDTQITSNFLIRTGIRSILATKTILENEIGSGLNQMRYIVRPYYRLMPGLNVFAEYELEKNYGAFKRMQILEREASNQNTLTFGLSVIF